MRDTNRGRSRGLALCFMTNTMMMIASTALGAPSTARDASQTSRFVSDTCLSTHLAGQVERRLPSEGEEPSPRAITMSAVGSFAAVPTVSGHSLRALKRANARASKPVVRSGASIA